MNRLRLEANETVVKQGKANRAKILLSQGGELTLTNQRLLFQGHGKNLTEGTISIDLKDILSYKKAFTISLIVPIPIPNALKITLKNGTSYKFTVFGRRHWLQTLDSVYR